MSNSARENTAYSSIFHSDSCNTLMSHLLTGTKFSDFATFVFLVPWFRGSARSGHIGFHTVKY